MNWFNNLLIKWKLMLSFGIIIIFTTLLVIYSVITINIIDNRYTYLLTFPQQRLSILESLRESFTDIRRIALIAVLESGNVEVVQIFEEQFHQVYTKAQNSITEYIQGNINDMSRDHDYFVEYNERASILSSALTEYKTQVFDPIIAAAKSDDFETGKIMASEGAYILENASSIINELHELAQNYLQDSSDHVTSSKTMSVRLFIIVSTLVILLSAFTAFLINRILSKPIRRLLDLSNDLARGNLNINKEKVFNDEIGQLMSAMYKLTDTIQLLTREMDIMGKEFADGDIETRINLSGFEGSYLSVAEAINNMVGEVINETSMFMNCLEKFGNGDFDANIRELPGKKAIMNENLATLRNNLKSVASDINLLIRETSVGNLSNRVDTTKYGGDWADLLEGMNQLMETIIAPINESSEVLHQVSLGNFEHKVEGNYKGDFMKIKNSINNTVTNIASYINEISEVLGDMADNNNLDLEISRDYVGSFSNIKIAINNIITKFNNVVNDILSASEQVANGASQVSESSITLAHGATEQASSIELLNSSITNLDQGTDKNVENTKNAENLSIASKQNALSGDQNMGDMLASMESINDSSNNIANIIKTIDDIAFQTNLLALNAAVEAARAGTHGKGFAVVAEEVRSLAARSQNAAKETAKLIEESIFRVNDGTKIADTTADALRVIVDDVTKISDIITNITLASTEQSETIKKISLGISQITEVVQSNSATSEEVASASQELSSQAIVLRNLVSVFNLKQN